LPAFTLLLLQLLTAAVVAFVQEICHTPDILVVKPDFDVFAIKEYLKQNLRVILLSLCLAVFFPLWIQSTLHFENITSLIMILVGMSSPHNSASILT